MVVPESSLTVWFAPLTKVGSSLTALTTIVKVCATERSTPPFAVPPLSCTCTVTTAEPLAFAVRVKVSVPSLAMSGWVEKRALLLLERTKSAITCAASSSAGPASKPVAHPARVVVPLSSLTVGLAPSVKAGASLTAVTVMVKVCARLRSSPPLAVPPLSCTWTVTVAVPLAWPAGV